MFITPCHTLALILPIHILAYKGGDTMKEYIVFIHDPESAMVCKVEVVRARSRRKAMRILHKMGFKRRKF